MVDVFKVADLLVARTIETYGDEVDLIAYYGSYAKGTPNARSDFDIFYTPAEGRNPPAGHTFLIEGILFDFWAVPWERLEAWASGRNGGWSRFAGIVHHANLLHARSSESASRFAGLKQRTLDLQKPEARPQMIRRALDEFKTVLAHLGNVRLAATGGGGVSDARHAGWKLILAVGECLALANQTLVDQGGKGFLEQLALLPIRPAELNSPIITISTSPDPARIAAAAERLVMDTRSVLCAFQSSLPPAVPSVEARFRESYPETKAGLGKILTACEGALRVDASRAAWFAQFDQSLMLSALRSGAGHGDFNLYSEFASFYREIGLPDLMRFADGDLSELANQAGVFDARIREWLGEQSVSLCEFATLEDFDRSVRKERPG